MNAGKRKRNSVRLTLPPPHLWWTTAASSMGPPARPPTRQQFLSVKPSVLGIYISAIIILVYNTRLEYHCMHEHVRTIYCMQYLCSIVRYGRDSERSWHWLRATGREEKATQRHQLASRDHLWGILFSLVPPTTICWDCHACMAYPASYRPLIFDQQEQARVLQILLYGRWTGSRSACPLGSHVSFIRYLLLNKYIYQEHGPHKQRGQLAFYYSHQIFIFYTNSVFEWLIYRRLVYFETKP